MVEKKIKPVKSASKCCKVETFSSRHKFRVFLPVSNVLCCSDQGIRGMCIKIVLLARQNPLDFEQIDTIFKLSNRLFIKTNQNLPT